MICLQDEKFDRVFWREIRFFLIVIWYGFGVKFFYFFIFGCFNYMFDVDGSFVNFLVNS